jgi:8-oxo-dGTP diphosphatase
MIEVVCGIIYNGNKIFIARKKQGKSLASYWEFPGGKIEQGEKPEVALERELNEELEMEINIKGFIGKSIYDYGNFKIELYGYECSLINYKGKLTDHDSYVWTDIEELSNYKLAPADIPFIRMIANK